MPELFEPCSIGTLTLANRFVRSATNEGCAEEDGAVTPRLCGLLAEVARGGVGLVISGFAPVSAHGRVCARQLAAYDDNCIPGLAELARAVHGAGGKLALQGAHGGAAIFTPTPGQDIIGPDARGADLKYPCRAATAADLRQVAQDFGRAAARAREAGCDAFQIHAAHGYLLSQFLSPALNHRADAYGGSLENRARLACEVAAAVREHAGPDFPLLAKINVSDFMEGGLTPEDSAAAAVLLEQAGVDGIEVSGGSTFSAVRSTSATKGVPKRPEDEVYYRAEVRRHKARLKVPLLLVGGIRSYAVAEELVRSGEADFIALCRPLISEPGLVARWKAGDRRRSRCVSDNACRATVGTEAGLSCPTFARRDSREDALA